ncbi:MAG TPA: N-acetyl-alpha-D-glucosaminyl L-malate synthase BshA [Thermoanaerobaculia bacterium]|nr:N-acetyl-alpha-D-glucosaminyl L-malate synthase BshA [Thermoanaerobaculia bacterium]
MRVGITCYPTFGGSGVVATELGIALARRGIEVHFISYALPSRLNILHEKIRFHEVTVMNYPLFDNFPPYTLALATKMAEVADYEKLDILHVHYAIPHAISAFLAKQILRDHPLRIVTTLHGTDITLVGRDPSYLPITKFGIESSDGVTAVSEWLRRETVGSLEISRPIEVIHNFVDPSRFHKNDSFVCRGFVQPGEKLLGHVSNFRPVKRVLDVLEVFLRVARALPTRLVMIGDGPERSRAEIFCREHRIADRVLFLGNVPNLEEVVGSFDVFLLPSETESFGMAALEALASEVPVVASRAGGLPEVVTDGGDGYLLPVGEIDGMTARTLELLTDDELRRRFGAAGRKAATERFNVDRIVPRYLAFYEQVLGDERRLADPDRRAAVPDD